MHAPLLPCMPPLPRTPLLRHAHPLHHAHPPFTMHATPSPHTPPFAMHAPLHHACMPPFTMHSPGHAHPPPPQEQPHTPPWSNDACPPPRGQNVDTRFWKYYLAPTSLRAVMIKVLITVLYSMVRYRTEHILININLDFIWDSLVESHADSWCNNKTLLFFWQRAYWCSHSALLRTLKNQ